MYWSLGNLVSNQREPETVLGGAAEITLLREPTGVTVVSDFDLEGTVSHFDEDSTCVYLLDECDGRLAAEHVVNRWVPGSVTYDGLERQLEALRPKGGVDSHDR